MNQTPIAPLSDDLPYPHLRRGEMVVDAGGNPVAIAEAFPACEGVAYHLDGKPMIAVRADDDTWFCIELVGENFSKSFAAAVHQAFVLRAPR